MKKRSKLYVLFITLVIISQIFLSAGTAFGSSVEGTGSTENNVELNAAEVETVTFSVYGYIKSDLVSSETKINSDFVVEIGDTKYSTKTNENGYFEILNVSPMAKCKIIISRAGYLKREITDVTIKSDTVIGKKDAPVVMWAGDVNQDDSINMADVLAIAKTFGSVEGDGSYNPKSDISLDGSINMSDIMIIATNFNKISADYENIIVNPKFVSVACGYLHSVAIRSDGTAWGFGANYCGEYGAGSESLIKFPPCYDIPVKMKNISHVKDVKGGFYYSVVLTEKGEVWVCGSLPQSIVSENETALEPKKLDISGVKAIACYHERFLMLKNDGTVLEYGYISKDGEPRQVPGLTNVKEIAVGLYNFIALKEDGTVWAWGDYWNKELAYDHNHSIPRKVIGISDAKSIAAGNFYSVALLSNGKVMCWGENEKGQLGNGTHDNCYSPVEVRGLPNVKAIDAQEAYTLALTEDGKVWGWGDNSSNQLGIGPNYETNIPVEVKSLSNIKDIAAGDRHSLFLEEDGTLWGCGHNYNGQLGNNLNEDNFLYPVKVTSQLIETISK